MVKVVPSCYACCDWVVQAKRDLGKYMCDVCKGVLAQPVTSPCGHHFCKPCLVSQFEDQPAAKVCTVRTFRVRKQLKPCPKCRFDLSDFVQACQVNQATAAEIEQLQTRLAAAQEALKQVAASADDIQCEAEGAEPMAATG
jgi:E3 ubiquitin-protein ligase UHRF1